MGTLRAAGISTWKFYFKTAMTSTLLIAVAWVLSFQILLALLIYILLPPHIVGPEVPGRVSLYKFK